MSDQPIDQSPDQRKIERFKKPKKVTLVWLCRDESHDKILLFENRTDAQAHEVESGHRTSYERLECD